MVTHEKAQMEALVIYEALEDEQSCPTSSEAAKKYREVFGSMEYRDRIVEMGKCFALAFEGIDFEQLYDTLDICCWDFDLVPMILESMQAQTVIYGMLTDCSKEKVTATIDVLTEEAKSARSKRA